MTITSARVELLRRVPLFAAMTDAAYDDIAGLTESHAVPAGETVVEQGDEGDAFYVIVSGSADVRQADRSIASLAPGDFFGEIALIDGKPRSATVLAIDDLVLLRVWRAPFLRLLDEQPATRHAILTALTQRIRTAAPNPTD